ncbi:LytTR family DNA-binding domain-containing protein [Lacihabitans soyangensis]|uniref:HTH LytTR-type domain-containing protein n=1 Tax=Lacihabitans soyangensis TaxID=869394 RepID=A0AAE3H2S5_9BACT|nr:LytTR family DNA-binding domain-containing protein [Lacihabitans soyangensis]MCP9764029.1 hypothetical protein [Lacihabitans soyangensis]
MRKKDTRFLVIYQSESEAKKIDTHLRLAGYRSIVVTDNINQGIIFAGKGNVDIIIARVKINGYDVSQRLIKKRAMLGIKLIFYTFSFEEYSLYKNTSFKEENEEYKLVLNPLANKALINTFTTCNRKKFSPKKPNYLFLKSLNKEIERISFEDILFIEAKISHCNVYCLWGTYTISGSLSKLLTKFPETFIKIHEKYAINPVKITDLNNDDLIINHFKIPYSIRFISTIPLGIFPKSTMKIMENLPFKQDKKSA